MACAVLALDSSAVEQWFSNCGWGQNDLEDFLPCFPESGPLFFVSSAGLNHPAVMGRESVDSRNPFPLKFGVSGPKKAMPRVRQDFSLCVAKA